MLLVTQNWFRGLGLRHVNAIIFFFFFFFFFGGGVLFAEIVHFLEHNIVASWGVRLRSKSKRFRRGSLTCQAWPEPFFDKRKNIIHYLASKWQVSVYFRDDTVLKWKIKASGWIFISNTWQFALTLTNKNMKPNKNTGVKLTRKGSVGVRLNSGSTMTRKSGILSGIWPRAGSILPHYL